MKEKTLIKSYNPLAPKHIKFKEELKTLGIKVEHTISYNEYFMMGEKVKFPVHCILFEDEEDLAFYSALGTRESKKTFVLEVKSKFMETKLYERRITEISPY